MLTSWSEQFHPAGVVDRVGVDAPALERELDAAELGGAEVAALAENLAAQLAAIDAHPGVVGAVRPPRRPSGWRP